MSACAYDQLVEGVVVSVLLTPRRSPLRPPRALIRLSVLAHHEERREAPGEVMKLLNRETDTSREGSEQAKRDPLRDLWAQLSTFNEL